MNMDDTVALYAESSPDVQIIRTRHSKSKDSMKAKLRAANTDPGQRERSSTRKMERTLQYRTMSPGRGATLMPSNYGRKGTGRTPGGRMGSANY